jgi:hypothetical protein
VAVSLGLTRWIRSEGTARAEGNHVVVAPAATSGWSARSKRRDRSYRSQTLDLSAACRQTAATLRQRLGKSCCVIERSPFVVGGDLSPDALAAWHEKTIGPAARAMAHAYFRIPPDKPITVLLFSGEHSYDRYAKALYGDADISIYGYYKRGQRILVMNAATGAGTVVHELTHALADFDCPKIPDWFNEGLASLHEQCQIRADETGLDGAENWRLPKLQQAIAGKRLRSLESLIVANDFRMHDVGLNYAQARYFCLWLQRLGLLEQFFARWRANQAADPLGAEVALALFPGKQWEEIDRQFQDWVLSLSWPPTSATAARAD